jgi:glycosyltransferase involved in cell wall biosynthesis
MPTVSSRSVSTRRSSPEPLSIGFYAPALPDSGLSNGIVTYTRIMRDELRAQGHFVTVVTTEAIEQADGRVVEFPGPSRLVTRARALLENKRDDGSHPSVRLRVLDAFLAARRAGVKVFEMEESFGWAGRFAGNGVAIVERLHGPHVFVRNAIETAETKRVGDFRQAAEFASFSKVQAVTSPTRRLLDAMADHGLDRSIARVIPNPMPLQPADRCWRMEDSDPDQILFVGRFDLCKGADVAIRAFALAAAKKPSLTMVVAGPDNGLAKRDGSLAKFEEFVADEVPPEIRSRIRFVGPQPPASIVQLRLQSALALVTSRFEAFGYIIAEPMAAGMPVLTSATFGGAALIRDEVDGMVVPIADADATAEAVFKMTNDPVRLAAMGRSGYLRARDLLSPERIALETVDVYREAIARA